MGKKGTPHRKWSKEEKLRFIRLHLKELVQTRNTLLAKERLRSYRRNEGEVSRRLPVPAHGCKPLRLLQVAAAKRNAQPL